MQDYMRMQDYMMVDDPVPLLRVLDLVMVNGGAGSSGASASACIAS
jgi:hypothetical protein